jgi:hypothetical protein
MPSCKPCNDNVRYGAPGITVKAFIDTVARERTSRGGTETGVGFKGPGYATVDKIIYPNEHCRTTTAYSGAFKCTLDH